MINNRIEFVSLLKDLCDIYKDYISNNDNSRLEVLIHNNKISLYLYKDKEVVDEFELTFSDNEYNMYIYFSAIIMKILFRNNIIYNRDNVFYNDDKRPYLKIVVEDEKLLIQMINIMSISNTIDIYENIAGIKKVHMGFSYNEMVNNLKKRVGVSRQLLKVGVIK